MIHRHATELPAARSLLSVDFACRRARSVVFSIPMHETRTHHEFANAFPRRRRTDAAFGAINYEWVNFSLNCHARRAHNDDCSHKSTSLSATTVAVVGCDVYLTGLEYRICC